MNCRQLTGNWKQVKGVAGENPPKLTDGDIAVIAGHSEILPGKMQDANGAAHEQTAKELKIGKLL